MRALLLTFVSAYLLGSIPFGYIFVRIFRGQDIRQTGSGNIGATNVSRTSPALGAATLILDALKGAAAVIVVRALFPEQTTLLGAAALFAIVGHMFPIWLRFRGGKGVATGLGSFVVIAPKTILMTIIVFAVVFLVFRYISLASVVAVASFPLLAWIVEPSYSSPQMLAFMIAASVLIVAKHHENIRRMLAHTEPRFRMGRG